MKKLRSTGEVRKLDSLGRIVLPISLRREKQISINDALEIYTKNDEIILQKYYPKCTFCDNTENITIFKGKNICQDCLKELIKLK